MIQALSLRFGHHGRTGVHFGRDAKHQREPGKASPPWPGDSLAKGLVQSKCDITKFRFTNHEHGPQITQIAQIFTSLLPPPRKWPYGRDPGVKALVPPEPLLLTLDARSWTRDVGPGPSQILLISFPNRYKLTPVSLPRRLLGGSKRTLLDLAENSRPTPLLRREMGFCASGRQQNGFGLSDLILDPLRRES